MPISHPADPPVARDSMSLSGAGFPSKDGVSTAVGCNDVSGRPRRSRHNPLRRSITGQASVHASPRAQVSRHQLSTAQERAPACFRKRFYAGIRTGAGESTPDTAKSGSIWAAAQTLACNVISWGSGLGAATPCRSPATAPTDTFSRFFSRPDPKFGEAASIDPTPTLRYEGDRIIEIE